MSVLEELPYVFLIIGAILVGLWISNILYDLKVPQWISRKIGHAAGGLGFLICMYVFDSGWWVFALSLGFLILLWSARYIRPHTFRGVGGSGRKGAMAEIWFPLSAVVVVPVGWIWLGKPVLTVACLLTMAWGDCVTGIVRSQYVSKSQKHWSGSVACFVTCFIIFWALVKPFYLAPIIATVATATEWLCGDVGKIRVLDDNLMMPIVSLAVALAVLGAAGML
jgi:dolichol kinase